MRSEITPHGLIKGGSGKNAIWTHLHVVATPVRMGAPEIQVSLHVRQRWRPAELSARRDVIPALTADFRTPVRHVWRRPNVAQGPQQLLLVSQVGFFSNDHWVHLCLPVGRLLLPPGDGGRALQAEVGLHVSSGSTQTEYLSISVFLAAYMLNSNPFI